MIGKKFHAEEFFLNFPLFLLNAKLKWKNGFDQNNYTNHFNIQIYKSYRFTVI